MSISFKKSVTQTVHRDENLIKWFQFDIKNLHGFFRMWLRFRALSWNLRF